MWGGGVEGHNIWGLHFQSLYSRDIWRCSCSSCTQTTYCSASCCSLLTSSLRCSGALRLPLAYSNTPCDDQLAETWFLPSFANVVFAWLPVHVHTFNSIWTFVFVLYDTMQTQTHIYIHTSERMFVFYIFTLKRAKCPYKDCHGVCVKLSSLY